MCSICVRWSELVIPSQLRDYYQIYFPTNWMSVRSKRVVSSICVGWFWRPPHHHSLKISISEFLYLYYLFLHLIWMPFHHCSLKRKFSTWRWNSEEQFVLAKTKKLWITALLNNKVWFFVVGNLYYFNFYFFRTQIKKGFPHFCDYDPITCAGGVDRGGLAS